VPLAGTVGDQPASGRRVRRPTAGTTRRIWKVPIHPRPPWPDRRQPWSPGLRPYRAGRWSWHPQTRFCLQGRILRGPARHPGRHLGKQRQECGVVAFHGADVDRLPCRRCCRPGARHSALVRSRGIDIAAGVDSRRAGQRQMGKCRAAVVLQWAQRRSHVADLEVAIDTGGDARRIPNAPMRLLPAE